MQHLHRDDIYEMGQDDYLFEDTYLGSRADSNVDGGSEEMPKVLLLSESIASGKGGKDRGMKPDSRAKTGSINNMKDNDITKKAPPWADVTTVMMRNLPNKYTQQMLLQELQDGGFRLQYDFDFFYLPMDHSNAANLGYCFINFVEPALANAFASAFQGKKMRRFNSNKTVVIMPASVQGFERNYAYYSSTRVVQAEDPQYRPIFLKNLSSSAGQAGASASAGPKGAGGKSRGCGAKGAGKEPCRGAKGGGAGGRQLQGPGPGFGGCGGLGNPGLGPLSDPAGGAAGAMLGGPGPCPCGNGYAFAAPSFGPCAAEDPAAMPPSPCGHAFLAAGGAASNSRTSGPPVAMDWNSVAPAGQGWAGPNLPAQQRRICSACGNECGVTHRFCAFCGADQSALLKGPTDPGMRADAPTFTPGFGAQPGVPIGPGGGFGPCSGRVPAESNNRGAPLMPILPGPPVEAAGVAGHCGPGAAGPGAGLSSAWGNPCGPGPACGGGPLMGQPATAEDRSSEVINDELDVMRGRMVLLAALRDMEEREQIGGTRNQPGMPLS